MEFVFPLLVAFIILATAICSLVFVVNSYDREKKRFALNSHNLLNIYLYFISLLSLAIAVYGFTQFTNAALSYTVGREFSYRLEEAGPEPSLIKENIDYDSLAKIHCYNGDLIVIENRSYCFNENQRKKELAGGISLGVSMLLIFAVHMLALMHFEKKHSQPSLHKAYLFVSLGLYSILSLIAIPSAMYEVVNYFLLDVEKLNDYTRPVPGQPLALAIIVVPLWLVFLSIMLQQKDK